MMFETTTTKPLRTFLKYCRVVGKMHRNNRVEHPRLQKWVN